MEGKNKTGSCLVGLALLLACGAAGAQVYKWKDAKGVTHFSDTPPAARHAAQVKDYASGAVDGAPLPYELGKAAKAHPVTLYTAGGSCAPCDRGRSLLRQRGVPFLEKTVASAADQQVLRQAGSDGEVPLLVVGRNKLAGFQEEDWNQALNAAGYPARSVLPPGYRQAAATPAAPPQPSAQELAEARAAAAAAEAAAEAKFAPRPAPRNGTPDFQF